MINTALIYLALQSLPTHPPRDFTPLLQSSAIVINTDIGKTTAKGENVHAQFKQATNTSRGWLGVIVQDAQQELAEYFPKGKLHGALIAKIFPDSPAKKAGLKVGDIIINFDNYVVNNSSALPAIVAMQAIGAVAPITVIRHGKKLNFTVKISKSPFTNNNTEKPTGNIDAPKNILNILVEDLSDQQHQTLGTDISGVMIKNIAYGPAQQAGIRKGDIILSMNNTDIENAEQFMQLLKRLPKEKYFPILLQRGGHSMFLPVRLH